MTGIAEVLAQLREREAVVTAAYELHPKALRPVLLVEYRCRVRGCLLLHAWQSPMGILFYKPKYKLSKARTESETVEAARAKNTTDGYRHWRGHGGSLDDLRGWPEVGLSLDCDHVRATVPAPEVLSDADTATPGSPTRRSWASSMPLPS